MSEVVKKVWNEDTGSAIVDWAILAFGVMTLTVAVVATIG